MGILIAGCKLPNCQLGFAVPQGSVSGLKIARTLIRMERSSNDMVLNIDTLRIILSYTLFYSEVTTWVIL